MSTAFSRTLRLLEADRGQRSAAGLLALSAPILGWCAWALMAQVTLREVSATARLEVDRAVYPVQSPAAGRVTRTWLETGRQVRAGEILVELDASSERLQAQEERTRLASLAPQVEALRRQINSEENSRSAELAAARVAADEARANARQAAAPAAYNAADEERLRQLHAYGLVPERDYQRARASTQQSRFGAERDQLTVERIEREQRTRESDRTGRIRALEADIVRLEGGMAASRAIVQRLENEIERRVVRAPVAGHLGEAAALRIGTVLHEGDQVAALIPDGHLVVVAQFPPPAALGRVAPGQRAELRLDGFPWAQYGTVEASVSRVASEVRGGTVRVEMAVAPQGNNRIPLQHGLPGSVEVEVERTTPATLILRTAGRWVAAPRSVYAKQ